MKQNFRTLNDILDTTVGFVPKQARFLCQSIKWLEDHGVTWKWSDADHSMQHLRCQLRTIAAQSQPPSTAPKGYPELQILIDKRGAARLRSDEVEVEVVPQKPKPAKRIRPDSDDDVPKKRCKIEKEDNVDDLFEQPAVKNIHTPIDMPRQLPTAFSRFRSLATSSTCTPTVTSLVTLQHHQAHAFQALRRLHQHLWLH